MDGNNETMNQNLKAVAKLLQPQIKEINKALNQAFVYLKDNMGWKYRSERQIIELAPITWIKWSRVKIK